MTASPTQPAAADASSLTLIKEWYYQKGAGDEGPVSRHDVWMLHTGGQINDNTLVWSAVQGGDWRQLRDTDAGRSFAAPPALPPPRYNNVYAWAITVVPLVGVLVEAALYAQVPQLEIPPIGLLVGYAAVFVALAALDMSEIRRIGPDKKTVALTWGLFFIPLYLFMRARATSTFPSQLVALVLTTLIATYVPNLFEAAAPTWGRP